jgi:hypothetical protein
MSLGLIHDALETRPFGVAGIGVQPGQGIVDFLNQPSGDGSAGRFVGVEEHCLADEVQEPGRQPNRRGRRWVFNGWYSPE